MFKKLDNLNEAIEESKNGKVMIFIHSIYCGASSMADNVMQDFLSNHKDKESYKVIIPQNHKLSDEIERILNVKHEYPQLIIIEDGKVVKV